MQNIEKALGIGITLEEGFYKSVVCSFLPMFLVLVFFVVGAFGFFSYAEFTKHKQLLIQEELKNLEIMQYSMVSDLEILKSDLNIILHSGALKDFLRSGSNSTQKRFEAKIAEFLGDRGKYLQIRYIDEKGLERVRLNYRNARSSVVQRKYLQDKSGRYYFVNTIKLARGEVYISPLDLNVEEGVVETPYMPTLRIAAPVYMSAEDENPQGILVLNYMAESMLKRYVSAQPHNGIGEYFIVNQDGYWLKSSQSEKEWGFMLPHQRSFAKENPQAWSLLSAQAHNHVVAGSALFLTNIIDVSQKMGAGLGFGVVGGTEEWYLIAQIETSTIDYVTFLAHYKKLLFTMFLCLVLLGVVCWQLARKRIERQSVQRTFRLLSKGLEQSPAAVIITNDTGQIIYVNPKFESMSGYSFAEVVGDNPRVFKSGKTEEKVYAELWKTIKEGKTWRGDFENEDKESNPYYVEAQISPIYGTDGITQNFIAIQEDVTEKVALHKKLEEMATIDALTGTVNRRQFMHLCTKEFTRSTRYHHIGAVLVLDLDFFKKVNDTYGHYAGDHVLVQFAECMEQNLRECDVLGRLGGEEFAVLIVEADQEKALLLAERLREATENLHIFYEESDITMTVSIGCSEFSVDDSDVTEALKRADDALYVAKEKGRNRVECI